MCTHAHIYTHLSPKKMKSVFQKNVSLSTFTVVLFTIDKTENQLKYPSKRYIYIQNDIYVYIYLNTQFCTL